MVRQKAEKTLQAARDLMLQTLMPVAMPQYIRIIQAADVPEHVRMRALADLLDRVGLGATQKVEQDITTHQRNDQDDEIERMLAQLDGKRNAESEPAPAEEADA